MTVFLGGAQAMATDDAVVKQERHRRDLSQIIDADTNLFNFNFKSFDYLMSWLYMLLSVVYVTYSRFTNGLWKNLDLSLNK